MNWKNLKLKSKLLLSFILISVILAVTGTMSVRTLKEYDNFKREIITAYELADAIMEAKYYLTNDALILMELLTATESNEISAIEQEHKDGSEGFIKEIRLLLSPSSLNTPEQVLSKLISTGKSVRSSSVIIFEVGSSKELLWISI